jgi:hypothetical protein
MRLHKATQDGKCPVCESSYRSGAFLLLNDDVTPTVRAGCDQCSDERVLAEMARLDGAAPKTEAPKEKKAKPVPQAAPASMQYSGGPPFRIGAAPVYRGYDNMTVQTGIHMRGTTADNAISLLNHYELS